MGPLENETELLRVLILEDNVAHARFVRALLEGVDLNLEIHYAGRLESACARLDAEPFDLIISDLFLPDAQGVGVVERLARVAPSIPLVVVTAMDESIVAEVLAAGADDCLKKDGLSSELLGHALRRAGQRAVVRRALADSALTEQKTGILNRRGIETATARCFAFAVRQHHSVTIIKATLPAASADEVDDFARLVQATVRDADLVGRLQPDQLVLVLPDDNSDPPAVLGRLEARRATTALVNVEIDFAVARFDHERPQPVSELLGCPDEARAVGGAASGGAGASRVHRRILVVSSDIGLVQSVNDAVGATWSVLVAGTLAVALRLAALEEPHVVLVDFALAGEEGATIVRRIDEAPESTQVHFIGVGTEADGLVAHRRKDYGLDAILERWAIARDLNDCVARFAI